MITAVPFVEVLLSLVLVLYKLFYIILKMYLLELLCVSIYLNTPKSVTGPRPHSWSRGLGESRVSGPQAFSNPIFLTAYYSSNKE